LACARLARLLGELQAEATVNVLISPEWREVHTMIISMGWPHCQDGVLGQL